jgi:hypothetical protein
MSWFAVREASMGTGVIRSAGDLLIESIYYISHVVIAASSSATISGDIKEAFMNSMRHWG